MGIDEAVGARNSVPFLFAPNFNNPHASCYHLTPD